MATGRTLQRHFRFYVDGYDLSGFGRSIGPFGITADEADMTVWTDTVKGYLANHYQADLGTFNGVFDNTATTGLHALMSASGVKRTCLVAMGIRAAPADGDPCFGGQFAHTGYQPVDDGGAVTATIPFAGWASDATSLLYAPGFGQLLHANAAATAVNSSTGFDNYSQDSTLKGGYMVYHVLASSNAAHTATLKVQEAADNIDASFTDLTDATTGVITVTAGVSGIVAVSPTATVRRYLRWQIVLGTATSVTFVLAFMRG